MITIYTIQRRVGAAIAAADIGELIFGVLFSVCALIGTGKCIRRASSAADVSVEAAGIAAIPATTAAAAAITAIRGRCVTRILAFPKAFLRTRLCTAFGIVLAT